MNNEKEAPQNVEQTKNNKRIITKKPKISHNEFKKKWGCTKADFDNIDDTKYFIDDFIAETSLNVIYARAKTGKSLFMQNFIHSLLIKYQNKEFYYIDNDNSLKTAKKRKIIDELEHLNFSYINKKKIYTYKGRVKELLDEIAELENLENCVIVFDSLRNFTNGADINKDKDLEKLMDKFELLRINGACVFLLHHTKKGDSSEFRGGNGIIESADNVFYLRNLIKESKQQEKYKNELYYIAELKDSRDDDETQKAFYVNMETKEFKEVEINEALKIVLPEICFKAYELLKEQGDMNITKLYEALNIKSNALQRNKIFMGNHILYEIIGEREKICQVIP